MKKIERLKSMPASLASMAATAVHEQTFRLRHPLKEDDSEPPAEAQER
jgi:hypothetical protein